MYRLQRPVWQRIFLGSSFSSPALLRFVLRNQNRTNSTFGLSNAFLHNQGAGNINLAAQPCDLPRDAATTDIIAFTRGEFRKEDWEYRRTVSNVLENDIFVKYRVITDKEYATDLEERSELSSKIETEIERNERTGYGVLTVTDAPVPACIVIPSLPDHTEGLEKLLLDQKLEISMKLLPNWQFKERKVGDAYFVLMRQQCGYVAGEEIALRTFMDALRRERKHYQFAPLWFETSQVAAVSAELIREKKRARDIEEAKKGFDEEQKKAAELRLRKENGPRANALLDRIHNLIHDLPRDAAEQAERRTIEAERRVIETERLFPQYSAWLNKRFSEQWETSEVRSKVDDFGVVEWNGRPLDGVIIKTTVKQRNRIQGVNEEDCFLFGLVDDVEFSMQRDPFALQFALQCDGNDRAITNWKKEDSSRANGIGSYLPPVKIRGGTATRP